MRAQSSQKVGSAMNKRQRKKKRKSLPTLIIQSEVALRQDDLAKIQANLQTQLNKGNVILLPAGMRYVGAIDTKGAKEVIVKQPESEICNNKQDEAKKLAEWIYADLPAQQELFDKIEAALGFKLFIWQKTFIAMGHYRRSGQTTAWALRELLSDKIIDFTRPPSSQKEAFERKELLKTKQQLENAGIKTAPIATNREQYRRFEKVRRESELQTMEKELQEKIWVQSIT